MLHFKSYSLVSVTSDLLVIILTEWACLEELGHSCVSQGDALLSDTSSQALGRPPALCFHLPLPLSLSSFHLYSPACDSRFRALPHQSYGCHHSHHQSQVRILLLTHANSASRTGQLNPDLVSPLLMPLTSLCPLQPSVKPQPKSPNSQRANRLILDMQKMQPNSLQRSQDGDSLELLGRLFTDGARAQRRLHSQGCTFNSVWKLLVFFFSFLLHM